ncbi:ADP-ribose pyrophosphatase YjhB (NUDIX family) [Mycobacterium sp. OAS707]|uniref:NUDIX hydrolase n=1 Tax=Mycobacterium sp. OAS707 TaxID=2663822 RepID=UPI001789E96C|nr:NUDIX domain-containing protein [Mycobacterium sp. OAS707]MBE1548116.1 ADP-ribose pyrophosphatase YjhB (NUDIX family) [Mycobacterium sp. OAS707]
MSERDHRDSSGRTLADYPRPSVAVDTALLTLDTQLGLVVLEVRRPSGTGWALPGTFLHEGETLADAVDRSLREKANVRGLRPRQLHVFDDPRRDNRGWVLSVAHIDVVRPDQLSSRLPEATRLVPVHSPGRLPYDHADIIKLAVEHIRTNYADKPDPDRLLGEEFTLRELRLAHEAVAGRELQRDTFRRTMEPHLVATGTATSGTRGRPAEVFRRR